jgi:CSLREA domain-containing protein
MAVVLASPAQAATFTVNSTADTNDGACTTTSGGCTLREAIAAANTSSGVADTINFAVGSETTITLTSELPTITDSAGLTIMTGVARITISGNSQVQVFQVSSGANLTLEHLTVTEGSGEFGGAIDNSGTLVVTNSTFSGNFARIAGGAISNDQGGTVELTNSTIANNSSTTPGGGGGINSEPGSSTETLLRNTIVANNFRGGDCHGDIIDAGNNLDSDDSCNLGRNSLPRVDPKLGPLADNGGPTQTMALLPGSPAINAGNNDLAKNPDGTPLVFDQRAPGFARIVGPAVDIGAYEVQNLTTEPPPDKRSCRKGGWKEFGFKNQGQCIKAVNQAS